MRLEKAKVNFKSGGSLLPKGVIVHAMSQYLDGLFAPEWLANYGLSVHAFIDVDGTVYEGAPDHVIAWHAGISQYKELRNLNAHFLGVELLIPSNGYDDFIHKIDQSCAYTDAQYKSLAELYKFWSSKYPTCQTIIGHSAVSGDDVRGVGKGKRDPGKGFDWENFGQLLNNNCNE